MTSNKNLVLIGMMGSGKSTVGAQLAHKLKLEFIDTDKEIEKLEKKTIKKIFEISGEEYFRKIEENWILLLHNLRDMLDVCRIVLKTSIHHYLFHSSFQLTLWDSFV